MCVFCSSTSFPSLLWWNKLCLVYIVLNPRCLPAVAVSTNSLELQISAHESSKTSRYLVPLFFKELINSKCTPWTNSRLKNSFLHDIIEWLRVLIERITFVKLGLKCSNFQPLLYQARFARIAGSNQRLKNAVFCRNKLVQKIGEVKMYRAALHTIPTQIVDSSQVLTKCIRQKQLQNNQEYYKKLGHKHKDLEHVCPKKRPLSPFNVLIVKDRFIQIDNISVIRHLVLNAQNS